MRTSSIARPGVSIRRGADRHQTRIDWLHGRHSFDTGIDPLGADTHHGVLVVSNHDTIAPRSGFETHPHRNMEIVTWVLNGSLVHQDSEGHAGVIYPNLAQRMTARHRHPALGEERPVGGQPGRRPAAGPDPDVGRSWPSPRWYPVTSSSSWTQPTSRRLAVVASGMTRHRDQAAIRIRNRFAALHVARLDPGENVTIPDAPFVTYLARGRMDLEAEGAWTRGTLPA